VKRKPTDAQRVSGFQARPPLGRGQAYRNLDARPGEDRTEALARAKTDKPWGARIVAIARTSATAWTVTIRELAAERLVRLKALQERRQAR
jgi:hypothetical protein